jgi:transcriptional regulator with XRE-family HTH domain
MNDDLKQRLSSSIRRLLAQRGWSQSELARYAGVGSDNISRYLRGKYVPNAKHLGKIADAFGVVVSDLYGEQEQNDYVVEFKVLRDDPALSLIRVNQIVPTEIAVQILALLNQRGKAHFQSGSDERVPRPSDHK